MLKWAIICLVVSLLAGGLGLTNISSFAKKLAMIFFGLFFLGFLALLAFAYLVVGAVASTDLLPAMVAVSV
jgi:uncharacterized membrane protein YtjA (UPF0391 family)